jgi:hypothetical protein
LYNSSIFKHLSLAHRSRLRIASPIHKFNLKLNFNFEIDSKLTNINSNCNTQLDKSLLLNKVSTKKNTKSLILNIKNRKKTSYKRANYKKTQQKKKLRSTNRSKRKNNVTIRLKNVQDNASSLRKSTRNRKKIKR